MNKTHLLLSLLFIICTNANAQSTDHVLPESSYPYWPAYNFVEENELNTITAQEWINYNNVITGWDWSLPSHVEPSPNSSLGIQRNFSWDPQFADLNLQFKANNVGVLWVDWRDIEPVEGEFNFTPLINRINQANSVGTEVVLRILGHSKLRNGNISWGNAPLWLEDLGVPFLPQEEPADNYNFDPSHPVFHAHYLKLVEEIGKTSIPQLVKAAYIGYASPTNGDEGIGPYPESDAASNDTIQHVRERLDAWQQAFLGMENKIYMGGASEYGLAKGFGMRRGFVEMYLYQIPNSHSGQFIDQDNYLHTDEEATVIALNAFNGDENEEYSEAWITAERGYRFGVTTNSFPYRYFVSTLRALQMRCSYLLTSGHLIPKMLPFLALELGRTVDNAPDVWTYLNTSYIRAPYYQYNDYKNRPITPYESAEGIETRNFERWLYQRDAVGYETTPAVKIQHAIKMWMVQDNKYYDYIARTGKKIGFNIDDRWEGQNEVYELAVKVTYFDNTTGDLELRYMAGGQEVVKQQSLENDGKLKTATIFITGLQNNAYDQGYDFVLTNSNPDNDITVSMARVVISNTEVGPLQELQLSTESGESTIIQNQGTLQMIAAPVPSSLAAPEVTWSLSNATDIAVITETGLLIAMGNKNGFVTVTATSIDDPTISATFTVLITGQGGVSVNQGNNIKGFKAYPNPFSDYIKIDNPGSDEFRIFNIFGNIKFHSVTNHIQVINTANWAKGIYLLQTAESSSYTLIKL